MKEKIEKIIQEGMEEKIPFLKAFNFKKVKYTSQSTDQVEKIYKDYLYYDLNSSKNFILYNSSMHFDDQLLQAQINRVKYEISKYYNTRLSKYIIETSEIQTGPILSNWSDTKSNIRQDNIKIYNALNSEYLDVPVTDVCLNKIQYMQLATHLANLDMPYNIHECKLDGIRYHNLLEAVPANHYIAFNDSTPIGSVEISIYSNDFNPGDNPTSKCIGINTDLRIKNFYLEAPITHGFFKE